VVGAVNAMSGQLKLVFNSLDEQVTILKNDKLFDGVSQLPNRQHLAGQMSSWLTEPGSGTLLFAKFSWLDDIYHKFGYQVRDQSIKILSDNLLKNKLKFLLRVFQITNFLF
jgi:GGDEF domain-containing protein